MGDIISGLTELTTAPAADDMIVLVDKSDTSQAASGTTKRQVWLNTIKFLLASVFAEDAGANDTYTATLVPAPTAYITGHPYRFKANTANTGACTINFNSLGAKAIKKAAGGITTDLADNDIRAGQWVDLVYDGTNMQMQSTLGNAPGGGGSPGGSDGDVQYRVDASTFGGSPLKREDADTVAQRNSTTSQTFRVHKTFTSSTSYEAIEFTNDGSQHYVQTSKGSGGGSFRPMNLGGSQLVFRTGASTLTNNWDINSDGNGSLLPGTGSTYDIGGNSKKVRNIFSLATPTLVSADFTKSANTTLSNVTGLTRAVESTKKYRFTAELFFDADATGGHKYSIVSSGSVTVLIFQIISTDNATGTNAICSRQTTSGGSAGQAGATAGYTRITGYFQGGAGNLTVQFAQNAASGSSSILRGSTFMVEIIEN